MTSYLESGLRLFSTLLLAHQLRDPQFVQFTKETDTLLTNPEDPEVSIYMSHAPQHSCHILFPQELDAQTTVGDIAFQGGVISGNPQYSEYMLLLQAPTEKFPEVVFFSIGTTSDGSLDKEDMFALASDPPPEEGETKKYTIITNDTTVELELFWCDDKLLYQIILPSIFSSDASA